MDYEMNGITKPYQIYKYDENKNPINKNGFQTDVVHLSDISISQNDAKIGTGCLEIKPNKCIYSLDTCFSEEDYDDSFHNIYYISNKEFTIDFWFRFDKSYDTLEPSTDLEEYDEYSVNCTNPYLFIYGILKSNPNELQDKLLEVLKQDQNQYYYVPVETAVGYNANTEKLYVEQVYVEVKQKQEGAIYPEDTKFFAIGNGEYYLSYVNDEINNIVNGKRIFEIPISANTWHHLSLSYNKSKDATLRIDFGSDKGNGYSIDYNVTTSYPPNKQGPISFGQYGRTFFRGLNPCFFIGNQYIQSEQEWLHWKLSITGQGKTFGNLYIDNLRIVDGYIDIVPDKMVAIINNDAYGVIKGVTTQLAVNWSLLSADQIMQCIKLLDQDAYPDLDEIREYVTDPTKSVTIESYTANYTNTVLKLVSDEDHRAIVEPKNLWDIGIYGEIEQVTADYNIENNGKIMIAPTIDLVNGVYFGYDFVLNQWKPITAEGIADGGIRVDQLGAIPTFAWASLGTNLAFGYYIEALEQGVDVAELNAINAICEMDEAQEEVEVDYAYLNPSKLLIKFPIDGKFKVNYFDKEGI